MPKPPRVRATYNKDVGRLQTLTNAVRADNRPAEWKTEVIAKLNELCVLFLSAPPKLTAKPQAKKKAAG